MLRAKGKALTPEEKSFIITLKRYFDRNKTEFGASDTSVQMVSDALEVGLGTVNRIMSAYNKNPQSIYEIPQPKGRPTHSINASQHEIVRPYIRASNLEGLHTTLETIRDYIKLGSAVFQQNNLKRSRNEQFLRIKLGRTTEKAYVFA